MICSTKAVNPCCNYGPQLHWYSVNQTKRLHNKFYNISKASFGYLKSKLLFGDHDQLTIGNECATSGLITTLPAFCHQMILDTTNKWWKQNNVCYQYNTYHTVQPNYIDPLNDIEWFDMQLCRPFSNNSLLWPCFPVYGKCLWCECKVYIYLTRKITLLSWVSIGLPAHSVDFVLYCFIIFPFSELFKPRNSKTLQCSKWTLCHIFSKRQLRQYVCQFIRSNAKTPWRS